MWLRTPKNLCMLYVVSSGPTYIVRPRLIKKSSLQQWWCHMCYNVHIKVRVYISRSDGIYRGQMVRTEVRWYIQRSECTYRGQTVHTEVRGQPPIIVFTFCLYMTSWDHTPVKTLLCKCFFSAEPPCSPLSSWNLLWLSPFSEN